MALRRCLCLSLFSLVIFAAATFVHYAAAAPLITAALSRQSPSPNEISRLDWMTGAVKISKLRRQAMASRMLSAAAHAKQNSNSSGEDLVTPISLIPGGYTMGVSIGTPAVSFQALADTGSDLMWVPCNPYTGAKGVGPVFQPKASSTYKPLSCQEQKCADLQEMKHCTTGSSCSFQAQYGGGTRVSGALATETVTMPGLDGKPQAINDISFGCVHTGTPDVAKLQGLVGLGLGPSSIVSQLGATIQNMFSYCLLGLDAPPNATSKLIFGASAAFQGPGVQVTSFTPNPLLNTFYIVDLKAIGVGTATPITIPPVPSFFGGTIQDSGTTLTFLQPAVYSKVVAAFKSLIKLPLADYSSAGFKYCVDASSQPKYQFPNLTLYFGKATIPLPQANYFVNVDDTKPNNYCLVLIENQQGETEDLQILGNLMQQNYQVLYDLGKSEISWKATRCDSI